MKIKNKGKVHPSPPPLPSFPFYGGDDCLSVLRLLPAVILALVSALSLEDREVLAYLITRSLKTPTTTAAGGRSPSDFSNKKYRAHKPPLFACDCFDCYTSYWFRWDSSSNRDLIHQIIEAFEDHLTKTEKNSTSEKGKKKDKSGRRRVVGRPEEPIASKITEPVEPVVASDEVTPEKSPERLALLTEKPTEIVKFPVAAAATGHKGLARKVLPDVLGLFNSRFWRLWNPNA